METLQQQLQAELAGLVAAVPAPDFHLQVAHQLAPALGCQRWIVVRYGIDSVPRILWNTALSAAAVQHYERGLYRIDVVYRHWREQRQSGVLAISRESAGDADDRRYVEALRAEAAIADELALLLPLQGEQCIAVCWDRDADRFGEGELHALQQQQPVLQALHELHLRWHGDAASAEDDGPGESAPPLSLAQVLAGLRYSDELSRREREIVGLITRGFPNELIARKLDISAGTVRNHRSSIYYKLDITSERELLALLLQHLGGVAD